MGMGMFPRYKYIIANDGSQLCHVTRHASM
jgi:hypothetical protein